MIVLKSELNRDDVMYIEKIEGVRKVRVHYLNRVRDFNSSFWVVYRLLDRRFIRARRQCFVNKDRIMDYDPRELEVILSNGERCRINKGFDKRIRMQ